METKTIQIALSGNRSNKHIPKRKHDFAIKLRSLLDEYNQCLIIYITNVGTKQITELRKDLRGRARFLFGKNTLIRKIIRDYVKETGRSNLMKLMDVVRGNSGLVKGVQLNLLKKCLFIT
eukprot:320954_1